MKVHFHRHHPLNKRFGVQVTEPIGNVGHKHAVWLFIAIIDVVIWI